MFRLSRKTCNRMSPLKTETTGDIACVATLRWKCLCSVGVPDIKLPFTTTTGHTASSEFTPAPFLRESTSTTQRKDLAKKVDDYARWVKSQEPESQTYIDLVTRKTADKT